MKIAIGCDHGALALKNKLVSHLETKGFEVKDFGTYTAASCDYPEFAAAAARAVASGECAKGIVLCTTGIGVSISANKIDGIRCALLSDPWVPVLWARIWLWKLPISGWELSSPVTSVISAGSIS